MHAHQVLQHLTDRVQALREMARVCRPGGVVAARDSDYAGFAWAPRVPELDQWLVLYRTLAREGGGKQDAGLRDAVADRVTASEFARRAVRGGHASYADLAPLGWVGGRVVLRVARRAPLGKGQMMPSPLDAFAAAARDWARTRVATADLDERDPDFIREMLPGAWLLAQLYFRAEVDGLDNIPEDDPVLLVGNHSGGNMTPDTLVFTLAFCAYFGAERPFYQLAHNLVLSMPHLSWLRRFGTIAASHDNARQALESGAALLVYPGGDVEVHRPTWSGNEIDFDGRKGWIRLALDAGVPVVPVVSIGGQETALFLSRGERLAKMLGLDRMFRLKVLPISLALPWGINIGDMMGHLPLPAKIRTTVLPAIDLRERYGEEPDLDAVYDDVTATMQKALDGLAAGRRLPLVG